MKRIISLATLLALILCALPAIAEEMAEYSDNMFSFKYPASWKQYTNTKGDIVVEPEDGQNAILAFALISNIYRYTGNADMDAPVVEQFLSDFGGQNYEPNGEYEFITSNGMNGFRAPGSWRSNGQTAVMIILTGEDHLVGFIMVGSEALALEETLLSSVELKGGIDTSDEGGWLSWQGTQFSISYPKDYAVMDSGTAVMFGDPNGSGNLIAVRAYNLDIEYTDDIAPAIASAYLPKSTHIDAEPEMVTVGDRNAAVIRGEADGKALAFYVMGRDKTALCIMLMGEEAVGMAEAIVMSAEIIS